MADGTIIIDSELDTRKLQSQLKAQEKEFNKITVQIEEASAALAQMEQQYAALTASAREIAAETGMSDAETDAFISQNVKGAAELENKMQATAGAIESAAEKQGELRDRIDATRESLTRSTESTGDMAEETEAAARSMDKFTKRLVKMAKRVFIFTVMAKALRGLKAYFVQAMNSSDEFRNSIAKLKGALRIGFQPLWEAVMPAIEAFVSLLARAATMVARLTNWIFGKSTDASAKAAEAMYDQANATAAAGNAAEKAKKQMSGLDEMNTWQDDKSSGGGSAGGGAVKPDFRLGIEDEMSALEVYIAGALLALGAILTFTGASPAIGIALMAVGAAGLASALSMDWKAMPDGIRTAVTEVMGILGGAALVIGAILAFTGVNIPLGIGLMLAGAAGLATAVALNWDAIVKWVKKVWAKIQKVIKAAGNWFVSTWNSVGKFFTDFWEGIKGVINTVIEWIKKNWKAMLLFIVNPLAGTFKILYDNFEGFRTKVDSIVKSVKTAFNNFWSNLKTGASGAWAGIKSVFSSVGSFFGDTFSNAWQRVKNVFSTGGAVFTGIKDGIVTAFKAVVNALIKGINNVVKLPFTGLNTVLQKLQSITVAGLKPFNWLSWRAPIPQLPMLAKGAVIPANHAFMAVLGDQKHGTNIEAPEDLIRKIVREEAGMRGNVTFVAQLNGRTIFEEVIKQGKIQQGMSMLNPFKLGAR